VRSSATAEGAAEASTAGQQETYLGISGNDPLLDHIKRCWAGLWEPRAILYRAKMGFRHMETGIAVIIQLMVVPETAGVMFMDNPVTGERGETMISAAYGLGARLVDGTVTPDTYIVDHDGCIRSRVRGSKTQQTFVSASKTIMTEAVTRSGRNIYCLTDADIARLTDLGKRAREHFGGLQDIEWAIESRIWTL
jgi:phosphoenolpyruvate synthase/pyruvate phosphate dikinase